MEQFSYLSRKQIFLKCQYRAAPESLQILQKQNRKAQLVSFSRTQSMGFYCTLDQDRLNRSLIIMQ